MHESTQNGNKAFAHMQTVYEAGLAGEITAEDLEEKIKGMRLDSKHRKGCLAFLNAWQLMVLELDKVKETPDSNDDKFQWLVKSLMTHNVLYKVCNDESNLEHTMVSLHKHSGETDTSELQKVLFSAFFKMLDQAAHRKNCKNKIVRETQREQRQANQATKATPHANNNCQRNRNNNNNNNGGYNPRDWFLPQETWNAMTDTQKADHIHHKNAAHDATCSRSNNNQHGNNCKQCSDFPILVKFGLSIRDSDILSQSC